MEERTAYQVVIKCEDDVWVDEFDDHGEALKYANDEASGCCTLVEVRETVSRLVNKVV